MRKASGAVRGEPRLRSFLALAAAAVLIAAVFLALTLGLTSCATSVDAAIARDGGARLSIGASVPEAVAAKFRSLAQAAPNAPLFDAAALRSALAARPGVIILDLATPTSASLRATIAVRSLAELAAEPDLRDAGLIRLSSGQGWTELRVKLERGHAAALAKLFPGIDPYLMDALSPPALDEEPISAQEYRSMLASILGENALPALDAARVSLTVTSPGPILDYGGGKLSGNALLVAVPALDALVLEQPIEFWVRWKD